jgi:hypothetical protein
MTANNTADARYRLPSDRHHTAIYLHARNISHTYGGELKNVINEEDINCNLDISGNEQFHLRE